MATAIGISVGAAAGAGGSASTMASVQLVASGLNQPKKITLAPDGSLIVAVSGNGAAPKRCTDGGQASCLNQSGSIDQISPGGLVKTLLAGLPSVSSGTSVASGPAEARMVSGRLEVLFQDSYIDHSTGRQPYGRSGALLGDLVRFSSSGTAPRIQASFGPFEAAHNPDHGAGTDVARQAEAGVDSDPYSFVPYHGGYAVADAGGNDLLFVSRRGRISVLAVFPTIRETARPGSFGASQTRTITARAQAVPDSVAVGPDGALYVGELGGVPSDVGKSSVYRVVAGHAPTIYVRGLTSIADIAFDRAGRLLVLEIDRKGLADPGLAGSGAPAPGAIVRFSANRSRSLVASRGLQFPTGMTVARDGTVYVTTYGITTAGGGSASPGGELVRLHLP